MTKTSNSIEVEKEERRLYQIYLSNKEVPLLRTSLLSLISSERDMNSDKAYMLRRIVHILEGKPLLNSEFDYRRSPKTCPRCGDKKIFLANHVKTCRGETNGTKDHDAR